MRFLNFFNNKKKKYETKKSKINNNNNNNDNKLLGFSVSNISNPYLQNYNQYDSLIWFN